MLKINIDGSELNAQPGQTILEAAREHGIDIPTLCHDERLKPYGGCGLCLVEVKGSSRLLRACATEVTEGMVVQTNTGRVREARRLTLELLLSDHTGDCRGPCIKACPAHVDIQGYVGLIANGAWREAVALIKEMLPLPASIGRVCPHPCEDACRRQLVEAPVAIADLKRCAADRDLAGDSPYRPELPQSTGKSVAVVGAGPAGLTAAYHLARDGHAVTVYEAMPQGGGMLRYGIPEYRLPKAVLDQELKLIEELGVRFIYNTRLGREITLDGLRQEYDAVFLGTGAWQSSSARCPGEDLPGVQGGIDFLREVALHGTAPLGERVAVIGGGNTAIDAARTAVRLGARQVLVLYRRTRAEMPAAAVEVEEALAEGVAFKFLVAPLEIRGEGGRLTFLRLQRMQLGEPDASGRRRPVPIPGAEETIPVDTVILAIGQQVPPEGLEGVPLTKKGTIAAAEHTLATGLPGVFAGGDAVTGPGIAIEAVAQGRRAALAISAYLAGRELPVENRYEVEQNGLTGEDLGDRPKIDRVEMPQLTPEERKSNFREVNLGLPPTAARAEAGRCLECGCRDYFECRLISYAREYQVAPERLAGSKHPVPPPEEHPFLRRDSRKCILCGLCVRVCEEVMGVTALGLVHRGFETVVAPEFGHPLKDGDCISCGQCAAVCPTGALVERYPLKKEVPLAPEGHPAVCSFCGAGCEQVINTRGDLLLRALPAPGGILCSKGRFGFQVFDRERVTAPLVHRGEEQVEVSWEEALQEIAGATRRLVERYGSNVLAVSVSPSWSREEAAAALAFGNHALGTGRVGSFTPDAAAGLAEVFGQEPDPCSYAELEGADLILQVGPLQESQVVAVKIRGAAGRGARLALLSPEPGLSGDLATLTVNPANSTSFLKQVLAAVLNDPAAPGRLDNGRIAGLEELRQALSGVTPGREAVELAKLYGAAGKAVIMVDGSRVTPAAVQLLAGLALVTGHAGHSRSGLLVVTPGSNQAGLRRLGLTPVDGELLTPLKKGTIKGIFILGEDPVGGGLLTAEELRAVELVVVLSPFLTPTARAAGFLLPGATPLETGGSFTGCDGRQRSFPGVKTPLTGRSNLQVLAGLAGALGAGELTPRGREAIPEGGTEGSRRPRLVLPQDTAIFKLQPNLDAAAVSFRELLTRVGLK